MLPVCQKAGGRCSIVSLPAPTSLLPCREVGELASVAASLGMGAEAIEAQLVAMGGNWEAAREALQGGGSALPEVCVSVSLQRWVGRHVHNYLVCTIIIAVAAAIAGCPDSGRPTLKACMLTFTLRPPAVRAVFCAAAGVSEPRPLRARHTQHCRPGATALGRRRQLHSLWRRAPQPPASVAASCGGSPSARWRGAWRVVAGRLQQRPGGGALPLDG